MVGLISSNTPPSMLAKSTPAVPSSYNANTYNVTPSSSLPPRVQPSYRPALATGQTVGMVSPNIPKYQYPYMGMDKQKFYNQYWMSPPARPQELESPSTHPVNIQSETVTPVSWFSQNWQLLALAGVVVAGAGLAWYLYDKQDESLDSFHTHDHHFSEEE